MTNYNTTDIDFAAFLRARGHRLESVQRTVQGYIEFTFALANGEGVQEYQTYVAGHSLPAVELLHTHRTLRTLGAQLRASRATEGRDVSA